jgi:hypothetical protein
MYRYMLMVFKNLYELYGPHVLLVLLNKSGEFLNYI